MNQGDKTQAAGKKITITIKQADIIKEVLFMGILWGQSLVDSRVKNGKTDLRMAHKAYLMIKNKLISK